MNVRRILNDVANTMRNHRLASVLFIGVLSIILVLLLPFPGLNVHYTADFGDTVQPDQPVTFSFVGDESKPDLSAQTVFPITGEASIRVGMIEMEADSLHISVKSSGAVLREMSAEVYIGGKTSYTAGIVNENDIVYVAESESAGFFEISGQALDGLRRMVQLRSAVKIPLLMVMLLVLAGVLLRLTMLSSLPWKLFGAIMMAAGVLLCFVAGVWTSKDCATQTVSYSSGQHRAIDSPDSYVLNREVTVASADTVQELRFPIAVEPYVEQSDIDSDDYGQVYRNKHEFVDRYVITIRADDRIIFSGLITPDMVVWGASPYVAIPVQSQDDNATWIISLQHYSSASVPAVTFFGSFENGEQVSTGGSNSVESVDAMPGSFDFEIAEKGFPYRTIITAIFLVLIILIIANVYVVRHIFGHAWRMACCAMDYMLLLAYACFQFFVYHKYVEGFPDEQAHISYVAFLKQKHEIIPDFSSMPIYDNSVPGILETTDVVGFNYLGHPPLFYHLVSWLGGMSVDGTQIIYNILRLRLVSFGLGFVGIVLIFYVGFTRIRDIPLFHLLFGLMVISPPNMIYSISGVSNDSLTLLGVAIFLLGIVRFSEQRFNFATYALVACGIGVTVLAKLTAGLIVVIVSVAAIVHTLIDSKRRKRVFKPSFWIAGMLYIIPLAYFTRLFIRFHTIQPTIKNMAFDQYVQSVFYVPIDERSSMGIGEYVAHYCTEFLSTWQTLAGHVYSGKPDLPLYALDRVGVIATLLLPFLILVIRKVDSRKLLYLKFGIVAIGIVMLYQLFNGVSSYIFNGYTGGYSSRYYGCVTCVFALSIIWMIRHYFMRGECVLNNGSCWTNRDSYCMLACACFSLLLVYDGFIGSVLYYLDGLIG